MVGVQLTLKAPDHVIGVHVAGRFEVFGGVKLDALAQMERVGQAVIADLPRVSQRGNNLGGARLEIHQTVVNGFRRRIGGHGGGVERRVETFRTGFGADHQRLGRYADRNAEYRQCDRAAQCCEFECRFQVTHSASDEAISESVSGPEVRYKPHREARSIMLIYIMLNGIVVTRRNSLMLPSA